MKGKEKSFKHYVFPILKICILLIILIGIPLYIWFFQRDILVHLKSFEDVKNLLIKYKSESVLIYIGLQIIQIVICFIPGQAFQFVAGYLYGFPLGLLFSVIGAVLGTIISFYIARLLGKDFIHLIFNEKQITEYVIKLNSKKAYTLVFLIYLIPGLPKDLTSYAAGVSEIGMKQFLILSLIGRTPGMVGSLLIGYFYSKKLFAGAIAVGILAIISFIICIIKRKDIKIIMDRFYEKIKQHTL